MSIDPDFLLLNRGNKFDFIKHFEPSTHKSFKFGNDRIAACSIGDDDLLEVCDSLCNGNQVVAAEQYTIRVSTLSTKFLRIFLKISFMKKNRVYKKNVCNKTERMNSNKGNDFEEANKWEVYIVQARSGKLYTGITNNLERRFDEHRKRRKGARFFRFSNPEKIIFRESQPNRSHASKREIAIKKMGRKEKLALIDSTNADTKTQ